MANEQKPNPATGQDTDISKAQAQQQPAAQTGQPAEFGQAQEAGQADEGLQNESATQQRSDIEGASLQSDEKEDEAETGFVGSKGENDTSNELVEEEDEEFKPDGQ